MLSVRSLNDNEPAYIQFQNKTSRKIDIVWINYMGILKKYVTLKPLESINVDTFKTHPWIFVDTQTGVKMMVGSRTVFYPLSNREVLERLGLNNEQNLRIPIPIRLPLFSLRQISLQNVLNMLTDINDVKHLHLPIILQRDIEKLSREKRDILSKYECQQNTAIYSILRILASAKERVKLCLKIPDKIMGSSSSKFKKYLTHGDEFAAMQLFYNSTELQRSINPNLSYGEHYNHDTPLHCTAKHGMKHLLRTFLFEHGGNPNKRNGSNETSLHAACQLKGSKSFSAKERRAACLNCILQWKGLPMESGVREKVDLAAQDQNGNTALHLAAAFGLEFCVEILTNAGSPLFIENSEKMTPCDLAVKNGFHIIAQYLESKMVFGDALDLHNEEDFSQNVNEMDEVYCGLRVQDLQEAKDQLLVETSDMLQVPLFTAEALLRDNEWSREMLLDKWMKDAVMCCQLAGVEPPQSAFDHGGVMLDSLPDIPHEPQNSICDICMLSMKESDQPSIKISCNHNFCFQCWETYLSNKIIEGMQHYILCPAYQCHILVPIEVIESLVSPDLARRYLHFDIKAFVESNKCIKWCPVAGCGRAVRLPETEQAQPSDELKMVINGKAPPLTSHAVDCGNGHFFCWECLGEAHAPSGCTQWRQWLDKVSQVRPEQLSNDMKDLEDASNCLWLVSNSKPCPNCKSPIQKNEGCNHIKCSKCKYDFCWVCLEAWKKHSSATGGYFRCNRFSAVSKADEKQGVLISEAVARNQQIQELNRFLHYYTRFMNHEHSRKLEETLLTAVKHKMQVLASSLVNGKEVLPGKEQNCTKFIEDGVRELLKARRVLCGSYVHGFYLEDNGYNKTIFEFMQNELETVTEKLSEMIARPYLKTPRHTIMQTTSLSRRKRHEFVRAVSKGLIPPETPPSFRKKKRKCPGLFVMDPTNEEELSQVIVASLKSFDANNPWVKDQHGRHNNLSAIYDWPDSDEETEVDRALAISLVGECIRNGCARPRARNPRTHVLHDYCSLRCARNEVQVQNVPHDDSMDLIIALEMSRLQMIEDRIRRENQSMDRPNTSISITQRNSDADLSRAIELSIRQQKTDVGVTTEDVNPFDESAPETNENFYRRTNEDLTVDYFLKTLAGQNLEDISQETESIDSPSEEKDIGLFGSQRAEDGRFEIGDIHETCFHEDEKDGQCLRRVHSTGDLHKDGQKEKFREETRYHLDSDHSSQHDDKPEDISQKRMSFREDTEESEGKVIIGCHFLFFQENSEDSTVDEGACNQTSIDDTTASDSLNADIEVCNILSPEKTERMSINDDFFSFQININVGSSTNGGSSKSSKLDALQIRENLMSREHGKQCTAKRVRMNLDESVSSGESSPLRKFPEKEDVRMESSDVKKCESVKNLKEVENSLKWMENERRMSPLNSAEEFSSPTQNNCQNSLFDFNNTGVEFLRHCPERASTGKIKNTDYNFSIRPKSGAKSATALENLKEAEKQLSYGEKYNSKKALLVGSEKSLNGAHKRAFKAAGGKIPCRKDSKSGHSLKECATKGNSNLKIRIDKSPVATDSSNEYETDTGIPKSPTLFISGVSISRTPEPTTSSAKQDKKSPDDKTPKFSPLLKDLSHRSVQGKNNSSPILNLIPPSVDFDDGNKNEENLLFPEQFDDKFLSCGRQGRSASLTMSKSEGQKEPGKRNLNSSCNAISSCHIEKKLVNRKDGCQVWSFSPSNSVNGFGENEKSKENEIPLKNCEGVFIFPNFNHKEPEEDFELNENYLQERNQNSLVQAVRKTGKSKSASEPEREREMFRFPKSSTDGALSSVLHVQESNLSSDDFHEVLFLLERSPKHGSKRKKKSKKERDKVKEYLNKDEYIEVSSAL